MLIASALAVGAFVVYTGARSGDDREPPPAGPWLGISCSLPSEYLTLVERGTFPGRSPDLQYVPREPHSFGEFDKSTHSGPWPYLQRVPLVFYGPGHIAPAGDVRLERETTVADIAPTLAAVLQTPFPDDRPGRTIDAVVDRRGGAQPPRMVLFVVWDGAGWNVLDQWPDAWPNLARVMRRGSSVLDVTVGSSPSVTPATHATMGTGAFPDAHAIVDIPVRDGDRTTDSFPNKEPRFMELATLADLFDPTTDNEAKVGMMGERAWHLGMMGRGAFHDGGDRDIAIMSQGGQGSFITNPDYYELPAYLDDVPGYGEDRAVVDASDGTVDEAWFGHRLAPEKEAGAADPVWTRYQVRVMKELWEREGFGADDIPDLFFVNFKEIDLVGHAHNMVNIEMRSVVEHTDEMLGELIDHLDATVGRGRWVMALTADHGSTPDPRTVDAWPIVMPRLQLDIAIEFGVPVTDLFQAQRPTGMWFDPEILENRDIAVEDIAEFILDYTIGDNFPEKGKGPRRYRARQDEKLFAAAFPSARIHEVRTCVDGRS